MESIKKIPCLLLGIAIIFSLSACNSSTKNLSVAEEDQDFRFAVTAEDAAKMPYTYSGERDGWNVALQVREATDSEKGLFLQELDTYRATIEENYKVHHTMTEEQYQLSVEKFTAQKNDLSENAVYISTLIGQYTGEQDIGGVLTYKMITADSKALLVGGIDTASFGIPWYSARNTEQGDYANGMFVPALEGCKLMLQYGNAEIEIPLTLNQK